MRKVIVSEFITLDGVIEDPQKWSFPYWNDQIAKFKKDELFASDALLLGRITYDGFAQAWPNRTDTEGFADRMNSVSKYVVSKTLQEATWENTLIIKEHAPVEVAKLKEKEGKDILIAGSAELIKTLMEFDLIDQYNLLVYPLVLGEGKRLFAEGNKTKLKLVEGKSLDSGVILQIYQTTRREMA